MDLKKIAPWNWFHKEEGAAGHEFPIKRRKQDLVFTPMHKPARRVHDQLDRLIENFYSGFGVSPFKTDTLLADPITEGLLKPTLDIGASDKEYSISVEVPGVDEKDLDIELTENTLIVKGEKKREHEEKQKSFYRMERTYGSFQRVLTLPEDADKDAVEATFKKGVLNITIPRKELPPSSEAKKVDIK